MGLVGFIFKCNWYGCTEFEEKAWLVKATNLPDAVKGLLEDNWGVGPGSIFCPIHSPQRFANAADEAWAVKHYENEHVKVFFEKLFEGGDEEDDMRPTPLGIRMKDDTEFELFEYTFSTEGDDLFLINEQDFTENASRKISDIAAVMFYFVWDERAKAFLNQIQEQDENEQMLGHFEETITAEDEKEFKTWMQKQRFTSGQ